MPRIGVVLSGSGVYDGSELHEAVITLLALDRSGAEVICMAPDVPQLHVVNHLTGEVEPDASRNVLVESARIARGNIRDIANVRAQDLDGVIFPGGFGAAKNLCTFAVDGPACSVNPEVERLVREMFGAGKPIAAVCIAPALLAKILGEDGGKITIGDDAGTASAIERCGATHIPCPVESFVVDREKKLITSPAYMLAGRISEAATGIEKTVAALLEMV